MLLGFGHLGSQILLLCLRLLDLSLALTCLFEFLGLGKLLLLSAEPRQLLRILLDLGTLLLSLQLKLAESLENKFSPSLYLLLLEVDILLLLLNFILLVSYFSLFSIC